MKKLIFLLLTPVVLWIFSLAPQVAKADNLGGVWVNVQDTGGNPINGVPVRIDSLVSGSYTYLGYGSVSCNNGVIFYDGPSSNPPDAKPDTTWYGSTGDNGHAYQGTQSNNTNYQNAPGQTGFWGVSPGQLLWGDGASCACNPGNPGIVPSSGNTIRVTITVPSDYIATDGTTWDTTVTNTGYVIHTFHLIKKQPQGYLDSVTCATGGGIEVKGWSMDPDYTNLAAQTDVHVYVDGTTQGYDIGKANVSRQDVGPYGFDYTFINLSGVHSFYAYGIDVSGNDPNALLIGSPMTSPNCSAPQPAAPTNSCPYLHVNGGDSATVLQGTPVTLSWGGGSDVSTINIEQHPSSGALASINGVTVSGGSLQTVPSLTTNYDLAVTYKAKDSSGKLSETCPSGGVKVTVEPNKSGSSQPVPPH